MESAASLDVLKLRQLVQLAVVRTLELRFGQMPELLQERIEQVEELDELDEPTLTAESLAAFEQELGEPGPSGDSHGTPSAD
jgi:hypothetical protein